MKSKLKIEAVLKDIFLSSRDHTCNVRELKTRARRLGFDAKTVLLALQDLEEHNSIVQIGPQIWRWLGAELIDI